MAKEKKTETETMETETMEIETGQGTAEACKDALLLLSAEEKQKFNVMVFNDVTLYNIVMGGV